MDILVVGTYRMTWHLIGRYRQADVRIQVIYIYIYIVWNQCVMYTIFRPKYKNKYIRVDIFC